MNTKTTLPISEARKKIFILAEDVQKPGKYYTLTEKGRPKAVIMSAEEFESWIETLEVMRDFPELKKDIKEAEKDYKKGNYVTLEDVLKKEGFILRDKGRKIYETQSHSTTKSRKRSPRNK